MSNPATQKKQLPAYAVLAIIALVSALALALTNAITEGPIRERAMKAQREAFGSVLMAEEYLTPDGFDAEAMGVASLVEAKNGGQTIGYCAVASGKGYAGPVAVTLGVNADGTISGAKIGDGSFVETAGFGSRWLDESQWEQFKGIDAKTGGTIEALSGATVTSTAVLNAANDALKAINAVMGTDRSEPVLAFGVPEKKPAPEVTLTGDVKEGAARGFQSEVKVQLTLDDAGAISNLVIYSADETAGFGTRCAEDEAFLAQFIGKTAPLTLSEGIEALSGATVTSAAVVEAINAAVSAPASASGETAAEPAAEPVPAATTAPAADNALIAVAPGFAGQDVGVALTLNADGTIATITLDLTKQAPPLCDLCNTEDFLGQFIGKSGPFVKGENVDIVSGATFTSDGIIAAVNAAMPAAEATAEPEVTEAPVVEAPAADALTAAAPGFAGQDVGVALTLNADGTIAAITLDLTKQAPPLCDLCNTEDFLGQFIGKSGPFVKGENVDIVSGATFTSDGIIAAVNAAMPAAEATAEPEVTEAPVVEAPAADATLTATVPAFAGQDITVTLTRNEDGTIATLTVDASTQSPGLGKKCAEEGFLDQFIGQSGPFVLHESIDAVSYATITSQAIVDAVNALMEK